MTQNPKIIAKLLRAIAASSDAKKSKHDVIFIAAADLLDSAGPRHVAINKLRDRMAACYRNADTVNLLSKLEEFINTINLLC